MRLRGPWLPLALAAALCGCVHARGPVTSPATDATLRGDPSHPGQTQRWVDAKLYFGLGPAGHPEQGVSEEKWRDFLDREVTPRFPSGLSVVDVYGQWLSKGKTEPERLRSKMLIIDYPDSAANRARIEAIRTAWKRMTGDESVLLVTEPAEVSF